MLRSLSVSLAPMEVSKVSSNTLKRRDFLRFAAGLAVAPWFERPLAAGTAPWSLDARILGVATSVVHPRHLSGDLGSREHDTAVVDLDLASGEARYHALADFTQGHSMQPLPDGGYFVTTYRSQKKVQGLFLGPHLDVRAQVDDFEEGALGGHSILLPGGETIVSVVSREAYSATKSAKDTGLLVLIDVATQKVERVVEAPVLEGHDIILLRDGEHFVVADDGNVPVTGSIFEYDPHDPAFLVYRCRDLELVRKISLGINGAVVHIEEGADGQIYGGVEQRVNADEAGLAQLRKVMGADAEGYLEDFLADPERRKTVVLDELTGKPMPIQVELPSPVVICDPATGEVRTVMRDRRRQLDSFDTMLDLETGNMLTVSVSSGSLLRIHGESGRASTWSTKELGIPKEPYGLVDIPDSPLMAVCGFENGVAVFDTSTMAKVRYYGIETFGMKHMIMAPA